MAEYWGLIGYPPPAEWLQRVQASLDGPLQLTTLADLRQLGVASMVRRVRSVRADVGLLLEDVGGSPLTPALLALLALTRCRRLEAIDPDGARRTVTRGAGIAALASVAAATCAGFAATLASAFELSRLQVRHAPFPPHIRRIAVIRTNLWHGVKAGGSVGHFAGIANALVRLGVHVEVLAPELAPMVEETVSQHVLSPSPIPAYPYELNYYRYHRRFVRESLPVLRLMAPDALYYRLGTAAWAGLTLARRLGLPLIVEYNGSEVWVSRNWGRRLQFESLARKAEHATLVGADLVTVVSKPLADELLSRGVAAERIVIHPNGVDTALFDPRRFSPEARLRIRRDAGIPDEALVCTFVGTFGRWHGIEVLTASIRRLTTDREWMSRRRLHFLLVGDGALMPMARRELAGLDWCVTMTGIRPQHETPAWLAASDVLLSPHVPNADGSRFFGSPTKIFEYMSMSRPIVASALEQIGEVLRPAFVAAELPQATAVDAGDRVAVVTGPGSIDEFVNGVRFVVEHPEVRAALGANARALAQRRFTWDANVSKVLGAAEAVRQSIMPR